MELFSFYLQCLFVVAGKCFRFSFVGSTYLHCTATAFTSMQCNEFIFGIGFSGAHSQLRRVHLNYRVIMHRISSVEALKPVKTEVKIR
jgi:hypothetical protein